MSDRAAEKGERSDTERLELGIQGMTCAGCASRVERKLNSLEGVEASLNLMTEQARIDYDPDRAGVEDFIAAVESAGYTAIPPTRATDGEGGAGAGGVGTADPRYRADGDAHEGGFEAGQVADREGRSGHAGDHEEHRGHGRSHDRDGHGDADDREGHGGQGDHGGHDHSEHARVAPGEKEDLRRRLSVATVLSVPITLIAMVIPLQFDGWQWVSLALAIPVVFWSGLPFHRSALREMRHRMPGMDSLISLGTLAAFSWSLVALVFLDAGRIGMEMEFSLIPERGTGTGEVYFEVAAVVTTFILVGRYLEARAKGRAGEAIQSLLELGAKDVAVLDPDGSERRAPVDRLRPDDLFRVYPGEKVATDGEIIEGESAVDRSLLTGESVPVEVGPGDEVVGATINTSGRLTVRATRVGADTALAQIGRLVSEAQGGKAPVQRLADQISAFFVPFVIVLSLATLAFWLAMGDGAGFAFNAAVSVLIIACPCALGLATPTALMVGTGRGAQLGIVIRGPEILETTRRVGAIVLDKTGTVTTGEMALAEIAVAPGADPVEAARLAGAVEAASEHPIAAAIAAGARERAGELPPVSGFDTEAGIGAAGTVEGRRVEVGRVASLADRLPDWAADAVAAAAEQGRTTVGAAWDGELRAILTVADRIKPSSEEAIAGLRGLGLEPVLLTGDAEATARAVAAEVGIEQVRAEVMPDEKTSAVAALRGDGNGSVAMVGDGVNDAPALAEADLGIAIGSGSDVAIEASDLTLVSGDLRSAVDAIRLSRSTLRTIKQNLFWAFAYNVAALPLAAAGYLSPIIAGAAMAASSVLVVVNSLRLRAFRAQRE